MPHINIHMTVLGKLFYSPLILENYFHFIYCVKGKFISSNLGMNILLSEIETANRNTSNLKYGNW